jgi:hypothetical protein
MESETPESNRNIVSKLNKEGQLRSGDWRGGGRSRSTGQHPTSASPDAAISTPDSRSLEWIGLEQAIKALKAATKAFPPIRLAADDLVSCLPLFEVS